MKLYIQELCRQYYPFSPANDPHHTSTFISKNGSKMIKQIIVRLVSSVIFFTCLSNANAKDQPLIFPIPQVLDTTNDFFDLDEKVLIVLPVNASSKDLNLAKLLIRELSDKYGLALKYQTSQTIPAKGNVVLMGTFNNSLVKNTAANINFQFQKAIRELKDISCR